jgi:hypothetical protein
MQLPHPIEILIPVESSRPTPSAGASDFVQVTLPAGATRSEWTAAVDAFETMYQKILESRNE